MVQTCYLTGCGMAVNRLLIDVLVTLGDGKAWSRRIWYRHIVLKHLKIDESLNFGYGPVMNKGC